MPHAYNVYFAIMVANVIENTPITNAYPPQIIGACEFETTWRAGVLQ